MRPKRRNSLSGRSKKQLISLCENSCFKPISASGLPSLITLGQIWVKVAAMGDSATEVIRQVLAQKGATVMYIKRVGFEDKVLKIRSVSVGWYDPDYDPPIPKVMAEVECPAMPMGLTQTEFVIDTGSDLTLIQRDIADQIDLWRLPVGEERIAGIGGIPQTRQLFLAIVRIGNSQVPIRTDIRDDIDENILGRDVLNWFRLTLSAQENLVRVEEV
jgi:hypothetical protein